MNLATVVFLKGKIAASYNAAVAAAERDRENSLAAIGIVMELADSIIEKENTGVEEMTGLTYNRFKKGDKVWPVVKKTGQIVRNIPITVTEETRVAVHGEDVEGDEFIFPRYDFDFKVKDDNGDLIMEDRRVVEPFDNVQDGQGLQEAKGDSDPAETPQRD